MNHAVRFLDGPLKGQQMVVGASYFEVFEYPGIDITHSSLPADVPLTIKTLRYDVRGPIARLMETA